MFDKISDSLVKAASAIWTAVEHVAWEVPGEAGESGLRV